MREAKAGRADPVRHVDRIMPVGPTGPDEKPAYLPPPDRRLLPRLQEHVVQAEHVLLDRLDVAADDLDQVPSPLVGVGHVQQEILIPAEVAQRQERVAVRQDIARPKNRRQIPSGLV